MLQVAIFNVKGMTCATCAGAIEKLLRPLNGINEASVSLLMNQAVVEFDENVIKIEDIIEEIEDVGFDANLSSVSKKRDKTNKKTITQKHNRQQKNVVIWSSNVDETNNEQYNQRFFYNITNSLPGIMKIIFNKSDSYNLLIYFDKTIVLPMTITHLLQSKNIKISDISLSKAYPNELNDEKKEKDKLIMSELKQITFQISNNLHVDAVDFTATIKTKFNDKLIESVKTKRMEQDKILLTIEFYDIMYGGKSTARMLYNYLLNDADLNLVEKNISILDAQSAERDEFRASQTAIVRKIEKQFYFACVFSIPCFMIAMIFTYIPWINDNILMYNPIPNNHSVEVMGILLFLLSTPVQFVIGRTFYISAWNAAKHKTSNMSTLIALGTTVAWLYSFIALMIEFFAADNNSLHGASHFFETSTTVITIVLLGKFLQAKAKFKTCDAIGLLMDMQSPFANKIDVDEHGQVINNDGKHISTELIVEGDIVKIKSGARIPLDGTVVYGSTAMDERMITGESVPRNVTVGDVVISSSINCGDSGMILMRVDKCKSDSVISKIIQLMRDSQTNKPKQQEFADTVSSYFVPVVIIIAILTFIVWYSLCAVGYNQYGSDEDCTFFAILFSMAVMVIACPCALGLATPTAVMVGMGVATKYGCLIKGGNVLEIAHNLNIIVFDKTGTLTFGKPKVVDFVMFDDEKEEKEKEILYCLGSSELNSEHPLAKAIVIFAEEKLRKYNMQLITPQEFEGIPGKGIKALIGRHTVRIGNYNWFFGEALSDSLRNDIKLPSHITVEDVAKIIAKRNKAGNITLLIVIDSALVGFVCLFDSPRPQSKHIIHLLQTKYNLKCVMLTGDTHNTATAVAKAVGIDAKNVISQVLPQDKHQVIKELQLGTTTINEEEKAQQTEKYLFNVAMVGDGINDAAALSQADLGIAIGNGAAIAVEAADVILMNDNLYNIAMVIDLSTTIIRRIYVNFVWALGFNVLCIPIAAGVLYPSLGLRLPPEVAAIAMACSSLCVLVSSIMLKSYKSPYNKAKNIRDDIKESQLNKDANKDACGCGLNCQCKEKMQRKKGNIYIPMKKLSMKSGDESDNYHYGEVGMELECLCHDSPACRCCSHIEKDLDTSSDDNF